MTDDIMAERSVVSAGEWRKALDDIREKDAAHLAARLELAAERRRMPLMKIDRDYEFDGPDGRVSLPDLFDGRRQLIVYRFFFEPGVENWPDGGCSGCSIFADNVGHLGHLHAHDTSYVMVSPAPQENITSFRTRMGWEIPWYTLVGDDFSRDFDVSEWFGLNVFLRDGDVVYRTYFATGSDAQMMTSTWGLLDITPLGRQEDWEDSPAGTPQSAPFVWYRPRDE